MRLSPGPSKASIVPPLLSVSDYYYEFTTIKDKHVQGVTDPVLLAAWVVAIGARLTVPEES